jgi:phage shock protein A
LSEKKHDDPIILDLVARVARLEERVNGIEKTIAFVKEKIEGLEGRMEKVDNRLWYVITGVILSILLQILMRLIP